MIDPPPGRRSTDGAGQPPGGSAPPGSHLDPLTAMRLADGEAVAPPVAYHAARCGLCAALVSTFRSESAALAAALTLDEADLTFLAGAGLPAYLASLVPGHPGDAPFQVQRDTPAT